MSSRSYISCRKVVDVHISILTPPLSHHPDPGEAPDLGGVVFLSCDFNSIGIRKPCLVILTREGRQIWRVMPLDHPAC